MGLQEQIIVQSVNKAVNTANVTGKINLKKILLFSILRRYITFANNEDAFVTRRKDLLDKAYELKNSYPNLICNYKTVLPSVSVSQIDNPTQPVTSVSLDAANFTVTKIVPETLFGIGAEIDTYHLKKSDFDAVYSDNNDNKFYSIVIYRNNLDGAMLKYSESAISGQTYGESTVPIEIEYKDIEKWSVYSESTSIYSHDILFRIIDRYAGKDYSTNQYTMTVNRLGISGNLPPEIGDTTQQINNRAVTVITLEMVTSGLTPPYNDPEGDLLDAIRIVEISTANKGTMALNGVAVIEGDVITREQLEAELLIYTAPSYDDIWADSFRFQGRDEGSGIWVD